MELKTKKLTNKGYIIIGKMWEMKSSLSNHRVIKALSLGRPLIRGEIVHHLNGDHKDNRPENLRLCNNNAEHKFYHCKTKRSPIRFHKIKYIREQKGITQQELVNSIKKTMKFNRTTLSWIETGLALPTKELLIEVAKSLDCLITDLYKREDLESIKK